jgi:hypothetical protein
MASKATAPSYAVNQPFDRTEGAKNVHFEPGADWPADHPDTEKYLEWQLIVPAPAGSSQPGKTNEGAE